ncbi:MAG: M15 family metallopeptidase, partial [Burkholderiaceae bacterium]
MRAEDIATHPDFAPLSSVAGIAVDLRYASANNFAQRDLYGQLNCAYLHRDAVQALSESAAWLAQHAPQHQ